MEPQTVGNVMESDVNSIIAEENAINDPSSVPNKLHKDPDFVNNSFDNLGLKSCVISDADASSDSKPPKQSDETVLPHTLERDSHQSSHVPNNRATASNRPAEFASGENPGTSEGNNRQVELEDPCGSASRCKFPRVDNDSCDVMVVGFRERSKGKPPKSAKTTSGEGLVNRFTALSCSPNELKDADVTKKRKRDETENCDSEPNAEDEDSLNDPEPIPIPFMLGFDIPSALEVLADILINDDFQEDRVNKDVIADINSATESYIHQLMKDMIVEKQQELLEKHRILTSRECSSAHVSNLPGPSSSNDDNHCATFFHDDGLIVLDIFAMCEEYPDLVPLEEIRESAMEFMVEKLLDSLDDIFC